MENRDIRAVKENFPIIDVTTLQYENIPEKALMIVILKLYAVFFYIY